jgi:hypothetical protein
MSNHEIVLSGKELLHALEAEIDADFEKFYHTGMKFKKIHDDELYKHDGYQTWEDYCRVRWDLSRDYVYKLMRAAEYRALLPDVDHGSTEKPKGWSERSVRELTRLESKRDAVKVAARAVKAVEESVKRASKDPEAKPLKLTATVRKFVDEELGIDRIEQARETKREREEQWQARIQMQWEREHPIFHEHLQLEGVHMKEEAKHLEEVDKDGWRNAWKENWAYLQTWLDGVEEIARMAEQAKALIPEEVKPVLELWKRQHR